MNAGAHPGLAGPGPLLDVVDLHVTFPGRGQAVRAVDGVSFSVGPGERVGIVGESGAGKSLTALAVMGLEPPMAEVSGRILFGGVDLRRQPRRELRRLRGDRIAMIFQDPVTCLNPSMKVGEQIIEGIRAHRSLSRAQARAVAVDLLGAVGIPSPARRAEEYPHRLSGGMAQRVMIAMAVSCQPQLIIADEPTTALDVSIEAQIIELLLSLCRDRGTAVALITHDLAVLARFADRIVVMHDGAVVEQGPVDAIYYESAHPYTRSLIDAVIRPDQPRRGRLATVPPADGEADE